MHGLEFRLEFLIGLLGIVALLGQLARMIGVPYPIFLTFCVILATLVVQGLSLPLLIRALSLEDDHIGEKEETHGRIKVADAALERLEELKEEDWVREDTAERVQGLYNYRRNRFASRFDGDPDGVEERSAAYQRLMVELLFAQRQRLIRMRDDGKIGGEVMHRIERDLEEMGYTRVLHYAAGKQDWIRAGLPIECRRAQGRSRA
ncbi:hypothetical protein BH18ACT11_BH18ACT11_15200 [soil metagenome]